MEQSFKDALVRLEGGLDRMGLVKSSLVMSVAVVLGMLSVHVILKTLEGEPVSNSAIFNIPLEAFAIAAPLIFYSRRVRGQLQQMTRRLAAAADEAQEASRAKSAFLANMSHELRTPLNAILGFSEIMKDQHLGPISPRYLSYSADIHSSGRHLLGIINDVLDLAKIESGKMSLDSAEEFALVTALSAPLAMLKGLGEKEGVTVQGQWEDETVRVNAVERMVRQIVINLVGNAIKFTPRGGHVVVTGAPEAGGGYTLIVRDNGVGMNESEMANAITPFGQNRTRINARHEGTGLGLPLAKAMMELHGGSLKLESQPHRGTSVSLFFPPERVVKLEAQKAA